MKKLNVLQGVKPNYTAPKTKTFPVHLDGNVCQSISDDGLDDYTGYDLGDDF